MPTFTPSPCRHCAHWLRREGGEDCAKGLLMRQPTCRAFEREPGADDDSENDMAIILAKSEAPGG